MQLWQQVALLAGAGAAGTLARWGTAELVRKVFGHSFPWSILLVNVLGCFLFGLIWTLTIEKHAINDARRLVVLTGFMGAYTTFSTFAFDSAHFLEQGRYDLALGNILLQNVLGIAAVFAGFVLGRW